MRNHLVMYINGRRHEIRGADAFLPLSEFLRTRLRLTATKVVCAEGDCGSCSVLIGRLRVLEDVNWVTSEIAFDHELKYHTVDACIQLMFQLDGTHVVTVEGLRTGEGLTPVQQALVELHGSQCGYCTPGFVIAMTGLLEHHFRPREEEWRSGLTGNLCRCTGYSSIVAAGQRAAAVEQQKMATLFPDEAIRQEFLSLAETEFLIQDGGREVYGPLDKHDAVEYFAVNPTAKVVAGGTDVGVQLNKRMIAPSKFLVLNRISDLERCGHLLDANQSFTGKIWCGALTPWSSLEALCRPCVPAFADIIATFGSPQIRSVATVGGNLVNASPIADSIPFFMVMDAVLTITSPGGTIRELNINDFYQGYRKTALRPGELLGGVTFAVPPASQQLALYKVSRRRDLDIASFTAAILLEESNGQIERADIALGAVGPTVLRPRKTEAFLSGKPFSEAVMRSAGEMAVEEISPISDVRGSADFRWQLTRNVFLKFFHERMLEAA